ncbi:glycosyltransferase [Actinomadura sp. NPDC000600]|uniref:glycosyltransferase family 2 protein n=1 Tax=Actinomadura sp. NPDC000600 TaxID=3154262 RepID=UPI003394A5B5
MSRPLVSVIVPVFQCRDTVGGALESAFTQSLPAGQVEVIAVDDGSTDGSGELLDELARAHDQLTVVHQPNSGGAGAPRNRGLELASGEFVFFLDSDDRLGPEALERMTAMAERNGTDIVLGKQVGTGGRKVPRVFERTIERTHVLDPDCDLFPRMSMAALQLFRRSLVEREGLRFSEGLLSHEDQLFTAGAYLAASGVSVLTDYDCYYWAARTDGSSATQVGGAPPAEVHAIAHRAMSLVARYTEPGELRERLHYRYLLLEVFGMLEQRYLPASREGREIILKGCRDLLDTWLTPGLLELYDPRRRVFAHCLREHLNEELAEVLRFHRSGTPPGIRIDGGRTYLKYPFFRDASVGVPDACYESREPVRVRHDLTALSWADDALRLTGEFLLHDVDEAAPLLHLVLENGAGASHRIECQVTSSVRDEKGLAVTYTASFLPAPGSWADGRWTATVEAEVGGLTLTAPVVKPRGFAMPRAAVVQADGRWHLVRPLSPHERKRLTLEVGGALKPTDFQDVRISQARGRRLRVMADPPPTLPSGGSPAMTIVLRRSNEGGGEIRTGLEHGPGRRSHRYADLSVARARPGVWRASFEIDGMGGPVSTRMPEGTGRLGPLTASLLPPRRVYVRLDESPLAVHVTSPLNTRARRALGLITPRRKGTE